MLRFQHSTEDNEFEIVNVPSKTATEVASKPIIVETTCGKPSLEKKERAPAWTDESEIYNVEIIPPKALDVSFQEAHRLKISGEKAKDSDEDDDICVTVSNVLRKEDYELPDTESIEIRRVYDLNRERVSAGPLTSVDFNTSYQMALTASCDTTLALISVDGRENALLRDRVFQKFPISSAKFTPDGSRVLLTGDTCSFRIYDLQTGKEHRASRFIGSADDEVLNRCEVTNFRPDIAALGANNSTVYLTDLKSLEKIAVFNTKAPVKSFCFTNSGSCLMTYDAGGSVNLFDLRHRRPRLSHQWLDQACTGGSSLASSPNARWVACGSDCGIVNVYSCGQTLASQFPQPDRSVSNLRTGIQTLVFHPAGELLCLASSFRPAAIRLYHLKGRRVFENFPALTGRLGHPTSVAFSPGGGFMSVGQSNGRAALFRIAHYPAY